MNEPLPHPQLLLFLDALRDRALAADSLNALAFTMANDSHSLLNFRQALVFADHGKRFELLCISGLAKPTEDSPYLVWLNRASRWVASQLKGAEPQWLAREAADPPPDIADGWTEWWPAGIWCVPLHDAGGRRLGMLLVLLDQRPPETLPPMLHGVIQTWAYCWDALVRRRRRLLWRPSRRQSSAALAVVAMLLVRSRAPDRAGSGRDRVAGRTHHQLADRWRDRTNRGASEPGRAGRGAVVHAQ